MAQALQDQLHRALLELRQVIKAIITLLLQGRMDCTDHQFENTLVFVDRQLRYLDVKPDFVSPIFIDQETPKNSSNELK
jgi:hypothetical protein